jgi:hypothetical protein
MQKWDYLHIWLEHQLVTMVNGKKLDRVKSESDLRVKGDDLSELLTQAGEDGWELVSHKMPNVGTEVFVFKRPRSP